MPVKQQAQLQIQNANIACCFAERKREVMKLNSFMSWIGGKKSSRDIIIPRFPIYYEKYVEVFGGGGWILFVIPTDSIFGRLLTFSVGRCIILVYGKIVSSYK